MLSIAKSRFLSGKKIIFTLLIIHCSLLIANAQWVQMSNGMGNSKSVMSFTILGNNIFAGTYSNGVYLSTNNGIDWTQVGLNNKIVSSLATNGNNILAGIWYTNYDSGGIYLSSNYGANWTQTNLLYQSIGALLTFGNNIFAGTDNGVYLSTNYGTSWAWVGLNHSVISLANLGSNIFAGTTSYGFWLSTNNGINWTQTTFNSAHFKPLVTLENNIFTGFYPSAGLYISSNNGINWAQTELNNGWLYSLATLGYNLFAGTDGGLNRSTNNGASWRIKNEGFINIPTVLAILITDNYIFVGTDYKSVWRRDLSDILGIQKVNTEIPSSYSLKQNYPNPFNPSTTIKFDLPKLSNVKITVYDITGKEIEVLVNEKLQSGTYQTNWNASNFSSGVYFYRLQTEDFSETKKLILLK